MHGWMDFRRIKGVLCASKDKRSSSRYLRHLRLPRFLPYPALHHRPFLTSKEDYNVLKQQSLHPDGHFWLDYARANLDWSVPPQTALDSSKAPFYRWFPDGEINVCHQMLDRHVLAGNGERIAIAYDSVVGGPSRNITYTQLQKEVSTLR